MPQLPAWEQLYNASRKRANSEAMEVPRSSDTPIEMFPHEVEVGEVFSIG